MLNSDRATKALSAVSGSSLEATNVPNVAKATLRNNYTYHELNVQHTIILYFLNWYEYIR